MPELISLVMKRRRLQIVMNMIQGIGETDYTKFVAMIELNLGVGKKKAQEYIELLKQVGSLLVENGVVKAVVKEAAYETLEADKKTIEDRYA